MSSSIQVTSATAAGAKRQSENRYIEEHCHNLKDMQKANCGLCDSVQRPPHTVIAHPPLKVWKQMGQAQISIRNCSSAPSDSANRFRERPRGLASHRCPVAHSILSRNREFPSVCPGSSAMRISSIASASCCGVLYPRLAGVVCQPSRVAMQSRPICRVKNPTYNLLILYGIND